MASQSDRSRRILEHVSLTYPGVKAPAASTGRPKPPTSSRSRRIFEHIERSRG